MTIDHDELVCAVAFERAVRERSATTVAPFRWGTGYFNSDYRHSWNHNCLVAGEIPLDVSARDLAAEGDRVMGAAGCRHRQLKVDRVSGERLRPGFEELGFLVDHNLYMAHRRGADHPSADRVVHEITWEQLEPSVERHTRREAYATSEEIVRDLVDRKVVIARATHLRHFGAVVDGTVASFCDLYSDGRTAQVEDVTTLEEYRGRGLSRAVIGLALSEARRSGHDFVFLIADAEDWPKHLYAKLGFDPIGETYWFSRPGR